MDPVTGRHTIIAAGRADRPAAFAPRVGGARPAAARDGACPFCAGSERLTPPEIWADRDPGTRPDTPGWRVRVIPNKYPAVTPVPAGGAGTVGGGNGAPADPPAGAGRAASGSHEVVVHGPAHHTSLTELPEAILVGVVDGWRLRLAALRSAWPGAVTAIVNQGRDAGASLEHSHSQIYATSFRPALVSAEVERLAGPGCAACATLRGETAAGTRVVAVHDDLVTLCPWASTTPMEAFLAPARHDAGIEAVDARTLARAVTDLLRRLRGALGFEPALNLVLDTAPPGVGDFHWHLHAYPRLAIPAGYELATGTMINVVDPDHAAARLRAAARPTAR